MARGEFRRSPPPTHVIIPHDVGARREVVGWECSGYNCDKFWSVKKYTLFEALEEFQEHAQTHDARVHLRRRDKLVRS